MTPQEIADALNERGITLAQFGALIDLMAVFLAKGITAEILSPLLDRLVLLYQRDKLVSQITNARTAQSAAVQTAESDIQTLTQQVAAIQAQLDAIS